jgi:predicted CXXCH cytochrome family protein
MKFRWLPILLLTGLALTLGAIHLIATVKSLARAQATAQVEDKLPQLGLEHDYVTSHQCQSCHPGEYASWHRSFHRTMTQEALPKNVAGKFDGTTIMSDGLAYRVFSKDGLFWADMPDPDIMVEVYRGFRHIPEKEIPRATRPVVMTTGSHNYQTYWVASAQEDRLLQTLPLVYLFADKRWIPREDAFLRGPADSGRFISEWNELCIRCHSTAGNPGLDDATGLLRTKVGELGIACEACHGPGEQHIKKYQNPYTRYAARVAGQTDSTIVNPAKLDHRRSSEVCGQCHGNYIMRDGYALRFAHEGSLYRPGDDLNLTRYYIEHPAFDPAAAQKRDLAYFRERWWDDGTILVGGREYTALSVSACYTRGDISCLSCHSMHDSSPTNQLKQEVIGSAACIQCHNQPKYTSELATHTHHKIGSEGSDCLNCHMPHTTYALLKGIRSHQISYPKIASSAQLGVPNACNLCHLDKTLAWTQEKLVSFYGQKPVALTEDQKTVSAALLWMLQGNAAQRVITAWHVGWKPAQEASGTDWLAPFAARLLDDSYGPVRYVAARSLRTLPGYENLKFDFLGSTNERQQVMESVLSSWRNHPQPSVKTGSELLFQPDGRLDEDRISALLRSRDNRSVSVYE